MENDNSFSSPTEPKALEDALRQEFEATLESRIERHIEAKPHPIVPGKPFAAVSSEAYVLYRDGHFYGCISLIQSVSEAILRLICERKGSNWNGDFEKTIKRLIKRKLITEEMAILFDCIWQDRNTFHHLNNEIANGGHQLEELAKNKIAALRKLEENLFDFYVNDGHIKPRHPEYWDIADGKAQVFLRFE